MFEMQSALQSPQSSKRQLAALAAFFHLTVATVLLIGLAWRIDAVEAPTLMEAFLPVAFLPAEWNAPLPSPTRPPAAAPSSRPPAVVQPQAIPDAPPAAPSERASEPLAGLDPANVGTGTDPRAMASSDEVGPIGGRGLPNENAVVYRADMVAPLVLYRIDPRYPDAARTAHRQGTVVVEAEIGTDGNLKSARVVSSPLGFGLEQSALDAVRSWRFTAARLGTRPIAVYYRWNIHFNLR